MFPQTRSGNADNFTCRAGPFYRCTAGCAKPFEITQVTLASTFVKRERGSGFAFSPFGRVAQRWLAQSFAGCAALGPVTGVTLWTMETGLCQPRQ
jgi:hypothetical protein